MSATPLAWSSRLRKAADRDFGAARAACAIRCSTAEPARRDIISAQNARSAGPIRIARGRRSRRPRFLLLEFASVRRLSARRSSKMAGSELCAFAQSAKSTFGCKAGSGLRAQTDVNDPQQPYRRRGHVVEISIATKLNAEGIKGIPVDLSGGDPFCGRPKNATTNKLGVLCHIMGIVTGSAPTEGLLETSDGVTTTLGGCLNQLSLLPKLIVYNPF